jgi:hypothetical protein
MLYLPESPDHSKPSLSQTSEDWNAEGPTTLSMPCRGPYNRPVSNNCYHPGVLHLPANRPVTLIRETVGSACCARSLVVPVLDYQVILPDSGKVPLIIPAQKSGTVIHYSCSTGRRTGRLVFDLQ